jgi:hypothetical protein
MRQEQNLLEGVELAAVPGGRWVFCSPFLLFPPQRGASRVFYRHHRPFRERGTWQWGLARNTVSTVYVA